MVPKVSVIALSYPSRSELLSFSASTRRSDAMERRAVPLSYIPHRKSLNILDIQVTACHAFLDKSHWVIHDLFRQSMANTGKWPIADPRYPFWDMPY
jgi:hypothetical protein